MIVDGSARAWGRMAGTATLALLAGAPGVASAQDVALVARADVSAEQIRYVGQLFETLTRSDGEPRRWIEGPAACGDRPSAELFGCLNDHDIDADMVLVLGRPAVPPPRRADAVEVVCLTVSDDGLRVSSPVNAWPPAARVAASTPWQEDLANLKRCIEGEGGPPA